MSNHKKIHSFSVHNTLSQITPPSPLYPLYTGGSFRYVVKFRRRRNGSRYVLATSEQIATRFNCVSVTYPAGQHLFHSYSRQLNMRCGRAVNMDGVVATRFSRVRCVYATSMELSVDPKKVLTTSLLRTVQTAHPLRGL